MNIFIGGRSQGKLEYVLASTGYDINQVCDGNDMSLEKLPDEKIINHFHLIIRRLLSEGKDIDQYINRLLQEKKDICIICDEIGCGVVPIDAFERSYREKVGRVMCLLCRKAETVTRIQCGIGTALK